MRLRFAWTGVGYIKTMNPWKLGSLVVYTEDSEGVEYPQERFELSKPSLNLTPIICATTKVIQNPSSPGTHVTEISGSIWIYHLLLIGSRMDYHIVAELSLDCQLEGAMKHVLSWRFEVYPEVGISVPGMY